MTSSAQFNALPLLSVKPALDEALNRVGNALEQYFAGDAENAALLQEAIGELHRANAVLRMLSLDGALVFCGEIEKLLSEFAADTLRPSPMHHEVLQRALLILTHFLDSLAEGAPNAALRLFDPYQELLQARGIESAFAVDLFFPNLDVMLPARIADIPQDRDSQTHIKAARSRYQQALLKWLRQDSPADALQAMHEAVLQVMACVPSQQRAFWWVASGLLDCMYYDGLPPELNAKKLLGRIDLRMKALVDGAEVDQRATLNEMLYLVASSHAVSETVEEIKQCYALDTYLPEEPPLPPGETAQVLEQMRPLLNSAEETWEKCVMQDEAACRSLGHLTEQLQILSERLDRNTLQLLCKQIHGAALHVEDAEYRKRISIDMAMALILLGSGVAHYAYLGDLFHEQVRMLGQRLQHVPAEMPDAAQLVPLYCEMVQREIVPLLAEAMQNNLEQVEQELNVFFADQDQRQELPVLVRMLTHVQGGLHMLTLHAAEALGSKVREMVTRYADGGHATEEDMAAVAQAISALGAYVHDLGHVHKPDTAVLERIMGSFAPKAPVQAVVEVVPASGEVSAVAVEAVAPEDNEMLEVFLEEAQDVLAILRTNLGLSQLHPDSMEPLVTMRRGFHTLKGSGRMVGLNDLGEVAWSIERAMNKWLQDNKPATPGLLQFIADAEVLFHAWVDSLRTHSGKLINTTPLVEAAQRIENGEDLPAPAPAEAVAAVSFDSLGLGEGEPEASGAPQPPHEERPAEAALQEAEAEHVELPFSLEGLLPSTLDVAGEAPAAAEPAAVEFAVPDLAGMHVPAAPSAAAEPDLTSTLSDWLPPSLDVTQPPPAAAEEVRVQPEPAAPEHSAEEAIQGSEADTVTIGKVTLSTSLFDIASEECASNLSKLQNYFAELRATTPPVIAYDFMRAAHTLAGVNRTMGFEEVADLSRALEMWLEARIGKVFTLTPDQIALVEEAIATLDAMFLDICNYQGPEAQPELIARLQADQDAFITGEAAPVPAAPAAAPVLPVAEEPPMEKVIWGATTVPRAASAVPVPDTTLPVAAPEPVVPPVEAAPVVETVQPAEAVEPPPAAQAAAAVPKTGAEAQEVPETEAAPEGTERVRQYVEDRVIRDEIDDQLLPIFLEESVDLQSQISAALRSWHDDPDNTKLANELQRGLHTLKGSARMAGVMRLGELTHRMEDRVVTGTNKALRNELLWDELDNYLDRITAALERLRGGAREVEESPVAPPARAAAAAPEAATPVAPQQAEPVAPQTQPAAQPRMEAAAERAMAMLRVRSETVDRLVNDAGEISVARSRLEAELRAFRTGLSDMNESVARLRRQLRELEIQAESQMEARGILASDVAEKFDPLEFDRFTRFQELTRFMTESVHDVQTVQQTLLKNLDEASSAMSAQAYLNRELQQSLMAIRMVPFAGISDRLYRIVRQTAKELQKRANLDLRGTEVELDRNVLDRMTAPFEHILRNCVAHGLEKPEDRNRKGKSAIGQIQVALTQESNEVVFDIVDDGAGIDLDALRRRAVERGLVPAGATLSDEESIQLIFHSGLSTAATVTEISGRGVGMDVVRNEITSLGGQVSVRSERGKGTRFTIRLPLTLAVTQVLMTRAGQEQYAIPSVMVEQVLHMKAAALEEAYKVGEVEWQGRHYPLKHLPQLLGDDSHVPESRLQNSVLLLHSAEQRIALLVDELLGNQETVVKNIGPQLSRMPGIAGATVLGSGRVVLILNPVALTQPNIARAREAAPLLPRPPKPEETPVLQTMPLVMVVDDSLTVRKVTSRMLARAGYEVATAKDGVDALEQLTQVVPDVMLLDVEMPRMDGFELTRQIRRDPKLHNLPILMITSRTAEKHRDYALELGVNAYFGKPFQEEELLQQISAYVDKPGR